MTTNTASQEDFASRETALEAAPPGHVIFEVMSHKGDTKYLWNKENPDEVSEAKEAFKRFKGRGYMAYKVSDKGDKTGEVLHEFDPTAERIIFSPPHKGG